MNAKEYDEMTREQVIDKLADISLDLALLGEKLCDLDQPLIAGQVFAAENILYTIMSDETPGEDGNPAYVVEESE